MAKTLIGNIKGKDGRGISKIERTATTGSVDTYTITYTDGTSTTYEVKNSDEVAIQRQIVPSASVEPSATASQAYQAGDYVVVNGLLRKATAAIAKGDAIGDTNSTAATVAGELATKADASEIVPIQFSKVTDDTLEISGVMVGGMAYVSLRLVLNSDKNLTAWDVIRLADMTNCDLVGMNETMAPLFANTSLEDAGSICVQVNGGKINLRSLTSWSPLPSGVWATGSIAFPCAQKA